MNNRLRELRKTLNISLRQAEIDTGIGWSHWSHMESGQRKLQDKYINLICLRYDVNETWLRTGEGEMFNMPQTRQDVDDREIAERYLLSLLDSLSPEYQDYILSVCRRFLAQHEEGGKISKHGATGPTTIPAPVPSSNIRKLG